MSGSKVFEAYTAGKISEIRNYCETDVLNTYCVYLRFERMRGIMNQEAYLDKIESLKMMLKSENKPHLQDFCDLIQ